MTAELIEWLASCTLDPIRFVYGAFPWGEVGTQLEHEEPDEWQISILQDIKDGLLTADQAIKEAVASGHGIGKTALVSWIVLWGFSTLPDTRGRVTAGTETQLKTVMWSELAKWFNLFIAKEHFELSATSLKSRDPAKDKTWRIDSVPWSENNPQAFAGMHNKGKRIIYIFDEGSAISDVIYETAEGALTDKETQIIWCVFGNPTRNTGRFKDIFGTGPQSSGWKTRQIDSRNVRITNKLDIQQKIDAYGEDSDYIRIRVRGIFPRVGEMEFISSADVDLAMARQDIVSSPMDPLALGVDVARYGQNESVLWFRKGRDGASIPAQVYRGLNTVELSVKIQEAFSAYRADGIFIDGGGVGGGVVDQTRANHLYCHDVQFGGKDDVGGAAFGSGGERYANKRAAMWGALRAWVKVGALPLDSQLKSQLIGPTYTYNVRGEIQLESKEDMMRRGVESPDRADALALTFAYPLQPHQDAGGDHRHRPMVEIDYNPYDEKRMMA